MATNVPATALSRFNSNTWPGSALAIGTNSVFPSPNPNTPFNWFVVVDLTNLKFVQSVTTTDTSVPPEVAQYVGNSQYFLYFITNVQPGYNIPQGDLYAFLTAVGGGPQLAQLEQVVEQLGTGTIISYSYILAATMIEDDVPGYEALSFTDFSVLASAFMPITIDGNTTYTPVNPFGDSSSGAGSTSAA